MGIYDQIHGECPHCGFFNGRRKGVRNGPCGFQVKTWITPYRKMTYDYYVGDAVPNVFRMYIRKPNIVIAIENCESCNKKIQISCGMKVETMEVVILPFEKA